MPSVLARRTWLSAWEWKTYTFVVYFPCNVWVITCCSVCPCGSLLKSGRRTMWRMWPAGCSSCRVKQFDWQHFHPVHHLLYIVYSTVDRSEFENTFSRMDRKARASLVENNIVWTDDALWMSVKTDLSLYHKFGCLNWLKKKKRPGWMEAWVGFHNHKSCGLTVSHVYSRPGWWVLLGFACTLCIYGSFLRVLLTETRPSDLEFFIEAFYCLPCSNTPHFDF